MFNSEAEPMKSKTLILFLSLAMLLPLAARAQVNYAVSGNTAYVTSSPNAAGDVVIDSTYNGYPVTSINIEAFEDCTNLTNVTITSYAAAAGAVTIPAALDS